MSVVAECGLCGHVLRQNGSGIYLSCKECDEEGGPIAYVGESDKVIERLKSQLEMAVGALNKVHHFFYGDHVMYIVADEALTKIKELKCQKQ